MKIFTKDLRLKTETGRQVIEMTDQLANAVAESGVKEGILFGSAKHTTALLTTGVKREEPVIANLFDSIDFLDKTKLNYLQTRRFDPKIIRSHTLGMVLGSGLQIPIRKGKLELGEWQAAYLLELLGPAERDILITIIGE
jgi:secondary thiamine-phosphate synthase enzyme